MMNFNQIWMYCVYGLFVLHLAVIIMIVASAFSYVANLKKEEE